MPQVAGDLGGQRQVGDDLLFGHVDDQARPFLELRAIGLHDIGDRDLDQRVDRDVDGGPQIDAELGEVEGSLERLCQRLLGQGDDVRFRCARQECAGHEHAAVRVAGTGERFDADELLLAQINLRLIPELDPAVAQRLIESDAASSRRRMAESQVLQYFQDGAGLERLFQHRQHFQAGAARRCSSHARARRSRGRS